MSEEMNRRKFGTLAAATAAVGVATIQGSALAQRAGVARTPPPTLVAAPSVHAMVPLPFAPASLPGLSERMLTSHHTNNYATAVRKLNEIRQQLGTADPAGAGGYWSMYGSLRSAELGARNSSLLHEMYFANLAAAQTQPLPLAQMLSERFGGADRFQAQLRGATRASNGWVVLVVDPASRTLELVATEGHAFGSWSATPVLVLDVYEHAYAIDFGADKNAYFDAFWRNIAWNEVHARATRAIGRL